MAIWFDIDSNRGVPVFKQIIDQVRHAIGNGLLKPGEQLPTVRELAGEHSINPNTIAKAYHNMESMGLVVTRPGVRGGTFIAQDADIEVRAEDLEKFQEQLQQVVRTGHILGLDPYDLANRFQQELEQWYKTHPLPAGQKFDFNPNVSERATRRLHSSKE